MPREHEYDPISSHQYKKKIVMENKIVVPCLDTIMIAFFTRNIHLSSPFARKARLNTERVPPGHPI